MDNQLLQEEVYFFSSLHTGKKAELNNMFILHSIAHLFPFPEKRHQPFITNTSQHLPKVLKEIERKKNIFFTFMSGSIQ